MADHGTQKLVKGEAVLSRPLDAGAHLLHLMIEDVSRADAAAETVGRADLPVNGPLPAGTVLPFEIAVRDVDPGARYSVRAHLDRSGSGEIESGDLISTQSYPVLTRGAPEAVRVTLNQA